MDTMTKTMQKDFAMTTTESSNSPKGIIWTGRVLTTLVALFMAFDAVMKLAKPAAVVEATTRIGFPEAALVPIGVVLLACTILYVVPRTAVLGAVLLTGYLGGAVAAQVFAKSPLFELFFPVIFGVLVWGGICLRNARVRSLMISSR